MDAHEGAVEAPTEVLPRTETGPGRGQPPPPEEGAVRAEWFKEQVTTSFGVRLGRFTLLRVLGEGGMGVVFAAYDDQLDRKVAIKLMRSPHAQATWDESWLRNEAKAMARLNHPNTVQVYEVGSEGPLLFVAMEFVVGVTLKQWLKAEARGWREVVGVLSQAGRGLQAAHEAGLTHCDFKPENVLVGADGRVRVLDFGLARLRGPSRGAHGSTAPATTGTPAYFAPELYLQGEPGPRSDQFAFCVALYEGLYGKRPFAGKGFEELGRTIVAGELQAPPPEAKVPAFIRRVVLRGLARDPAQRWPSMEALLAELARDPAARRRRWALAGAAALLVGLTAWNVAQRQALEAELAARSCDEVGLLHGTWDEERAAALRKALVATGLAYAEDTATRTIARLDAYARAWAEARAAACEAKRSGELSDLLYERQNACLEQRRSELGALAQVLAEADASVVPKAIKATAELRPLTPCADAEALLAEVAPPDTPGAVAEAQRLRQELATARAELAAGRYQPSKTRLDGLREAAAKLGYLPVEGEILLTLGLAEDGLGDFKAAAARFEDALCAAQGSRHDVVAAEAATRLHYETGYRLTQVELARLWERQAEAVFVRRGGTREFESRWLSVRGAVKFRSGDVVGALALYKQALAAAERAFGPSHHDSVALRSQVGMLAMSSGALAEGAPLFEEALAQQEELLGPDHPELATLYANYGSVLGNRGEVAPARRHSEHALAIVERSLGPKHPEVARIYNNLGAIALQAEDYAAAQRWLAKALALRRELFGPNNFDTASTAGALGEVQLDLGDAEAAGETLDSAIRGLAASVGEAHVKFAGVLGMRGLATLKLGRRKEALVLLERALALLTTNPVAPAAYLGGVRFGLARALWPSPRARARARSLATTAAADFKTAGPGAARYLREVEAWLAGPAAK